jgi:hypothetical protein
MFVAPDSTQADTDVDTDNSQLEQTDTDATPEPGRMDRTERMERLYEELALGFIRGLRRHGRALIIGVGIPLAVIASFIGLGFAATALLHHYTTNVACVDVTSWSGDNDRIIITDQYGTSYNLPDLQVSEQHKSTDYRVTAPVTYTIAKRDMADALLSGNSSYITTPRRAVITSHWTVSAWMHLDYPYNNRTVTSVQIVPEDTDCPS